MENDINDSDFVVTSSHPQTQANTLDDRSDNDCLSEDTYRLILKSYADRLAAKQLKPSVIKMVINTINDFYLFTNKYPWDWTAEAFDEWRYYLYRERNNCEATQRKKQNIISQFQSFLVNSPQLSELYEVKFGKKPLLIRSGNNLIPRKFPDENKEKHLFFTKEELMSLWLYFDKQITLAKESKSRKLRLLQRDKILYLLMYFCGLRANEVLMLDTTDLICNPPNTDWNNLGIIIKDRKVCWKNLYSAQTVWMSETCSKYLKWYLENIRPLFISDDNSSLFLSEMGCRMNSNSIARNFKEHLKCAGLQCEGHSTYSLRRSNIIHTYQDLQISPT